MSFLTVSNIYKYCIYAKYCELDLSHLIIIITFHISLHCSFYNFNMFILELQFFYLTSK